MSAMDAGTRPSIGAMQKPAMALDAMKEPNVFAAEPQNPVTNQTNGGDKVDGTFSVLNSEDIDDHGCAS